jgi:hypothetical protein
MYMHGPTMILFSLSPVNDRNGKLALKSGVRIFGTEHRFSLFN